MHFVYYMISKQRKSSLIDVIRADLTIFNKSVIILNQAERVQTKRMLFIFGGYMKNARFACITLLCFVLFLAAILSGCEDKQEKTDVEIIPEAVSVEPVDTSYLSEISTKTKDPAAIALPDYSGGDTLSAAYSGNVTTLNPFYASTDDETLISDLINVKLFDSERSKKAVTGKRKSVFLGKEFEYGGIASAVLDGRRIDITLDDDVYFSDGVNMTADDIIFTMYVLCDPAYTGENNFSRMPIEGLSEYRGSEELKWKLILSDMHENGTEYTPNKSYTEEEFNVFSVIFDEAGSAFTQYIIDSCMDSFAENYSRIAVGKNSDELYENKQLKTAFAEFMWGYAPGASDDGLWYDESGKGYELDTEGPDVVDFWHLIASRYEFDISDEGINSEKMGEDDFVSILSTLLEEQHPELLTAVPDAKTADSISGIQKTGMYTLSVTMESNEFDICDMMFYVCPLHVFGTREKYDFVNNKFGFEKGNLTEIKNCGDIVGAGAYMLADTYNNSVALTRNTLYYKGCPKISRIVFEPDGTDIKPGNAEGYTKMQIVTDKIQCIGIEPERVNINGDAYSEQSLALRAAIGELFKAYKTECVGEDEKVITCPLPLTSRFYLDTEDMMTAEEAEKNVKGLLIKAGYVWNEETEAFTDGPDGKKASFELICCEDSSAVLCAESVSQALEKLGIELMITHVSNKEMLDHITEDKAVDMWIADFENENEILAYFLETNSYDGFAKADRAKLENIGRAYLKQTIEEIMSRYSLLPLFSKTKSIGVAECVKQENFPENMTVYYNWTDVIEEIEMK